MTKTNSVEGYYSCKLAKKFKEEFQDFCNKEKIDYDDEVYLHWQKENAVLLER